MKSRLGLGLVALQLFGFAASAPAAEAGAAFDRPRGDGRRTLRAFPVNAARSFAGVLSADNASLLVGGASLTAASQLLDARASASLRGSCLSCGRAGATLGGATGLAPAIGFLFLTGRFAPQGTFRAASYDAAQALAVSTVWTGLLKGTLRRQRPDGSDSFSLPSGHTSAAFSLATVAERHGGWKTALPAYALATGIGLSRVEADRHNLSDVVAGAVLGVIVGRSVTRSNDEAPAGRRRLALTPSRDGRGHGFGLALSASW